MTRREFTLMSSLTLVAGGEAGGAKETLALGLLTDVHYADKKAGGSRHYRDSLAKGKEAAAFFRQRKPVAVVCLGDLIDAAPSVAVELGYLRTIAGVLDEAGVPRYHVPGNHCVATLTKEEFFAHGGSVNEKGHYSFDLGGVHFVILDACFTAQMEPYGRNNFVWHDSNLPPAQIAWLEEDLLERVDAPFWQGQLVAVVHVLVPWTL
jgi:alkaline phosphatase